MKTKKSKDNKVPKLVHEQAVESTNLAHVSYLTALKVLQITFNNGAVYRYYNVPKKVYDQLIVAGSKGTFFNENIKFKYTYKKVRSPDQRVKSYDFLSYYY